MTKKRAKLSSEWQVWVVVMTGRRSTWPITFTTSGLRKESIKALEEAWGEPWSIAASRLNLDCIKVTMS